MLEIGGPLAVPELGPLLDQQLHVFRMRREERQKGHDAPGYLLQTVLDPGDARQDLLLHLSHHPIRRGQEKIALAGKMAVDRSLAELEPSGQHLRDCIGKPVLGKQFRRRLQDLLLAGENLLVRATPLRFLLTELLHACVTLSN